MIFLWANRHIKNFKWYDIKLIKWSVFGFAWFIAALFVKQPIWFHNLWWVWLVIGIMAAIRPVFTLFGCCKKKKRKK